MLLLLESQPLNRQEAYDRVIRGILRRYLQNDTRPFRLKVPRFLLNDVHRFWRTMCVDYAGKFRERAGKGWALRNIKLRMSRKLIFAAGLLTCYNCAPDMVKLRDESLSKKESIDRLVEYLRQLVAMTPMDIVVEALLREESKETANLILGSYDQFLEQLSSEDIRDKLENLRPEQAESDELFKQLQENSRSFQKGLEQLFFEGGSALTQLNREYGVF